MTELQKFNELTMQLLALFTHSSEMDRDDKITKITELLDQREILLESIGPPFSDEDQKIGRQLIHSNQRVNELLHLLKQEIQRDMKELKTKKKSSNIYANPYENFTVDGVFYDKRN